LIVQYCKEFCDWGNWEGDKEGGGSRGLGNDSPYYLGHRRPRLQDSPLLARELLRTYLVSGRDDLAHGLLRTLTPSALLFEPLLFKYAALLPKGAVQARLAEEMYLKMVNGRVLVSDAAVSSLVLSQLRTAEGLQEAVDKMQDLVNQHRVRPTVNTVLLLLDSALESGDVFEARRVVGLIGNWYTPLERVTLKGMRLVVGAHDNWGGGGVEGEEEFQQERSILSRDILPGHRIFLGTPPGEGEPAVLSEAALQKRFAEHGLTLR